MVEGQAELGFATDIKQWFLRFMTDTRWFSRQFNIEDSNFKSDGAIFDDYSWADDQNSVNSHGRMRFYRKFVNLFVDWNWDNAKSVTVKGTEEFLFRKIQVKKLYIKYNVPKMTWTLNMDGLELETNHIVGRLWGKTMDTKILWEESDCEVCYSQFVTLINPKFKESSI